MPRTALAYLLVLAAALTGCGGGSTSSSSSAPPKPKESIQQFATRLTSAVQQARAGQCGPIEKIGQASSIQLPCGGKTKQTFAGFKVTQSAAYGTGGVVEFTDAEVAKGKLPPGLKPTPQGKRGIYTVAIGPDGRYDLMGPFSPILPGPTIGTKEASPAAFDTVARQFVQSVRTKDCALFYKVTLTPGLKRATACSTVLNNDYGALTQLLRASKSAKPVPMGGNAWFAFYGLRTGSEYRTLGVIKNTPGQSQPYLSLGTFKGPG